MEKRNFRNANVAKNRRKNFMESFKAAEPELFQIINHVRRNGELKRQVSLGLIELMRSDGTIKSDGKVYVKFLINRISVKVDGLAAEYHYTDKRFIHALLASNMTMATYLRMLVSDYLEEYEKVKIENSEFDTKEAKELQEKIAISVLTHISDNNVVVDEKAENE